MHISEDNFGSAATYESQSSISIHGRVLFLTDRNYNVGQGLSFPSHLLMPQSGRYIFQIHYDRGRKGERTHPGYFHPFCSYFIGSICHVWRRKWQPTPVFLPGESHGQRSLVGYSPWVRRVRHDWVPKPPPPPLITRTQSNCKGFWKM